MEANGVADQNPKFAKAYAARGDAYASGGDHARAVMRRLVEGKGKEFGFGGITDIVLNRDKGG